MTFAFARAAGAWQLLFLREALGGARSRRTYVMRTLYALLLLACISPVLLSRRTSVGRLADAGRELFLTFAHAQLYLLLLLAPLAVATAFTDEKEDRTAGLLVLTHLGARGIVLGKLLARLAGLELLVVAGLPVLGLSLTLGGVAPGEVLASIAITQAALVGAVAVASFAALVLDGAVSVALATYGFYVVFYAMGPLGAYLFSLGHYRVAHPQASWMWLSPLYELTRTLVVQRPGARPGLMSQAAPLASLTWLLPLAAAVAWASGPLFEAAATPDDADAADRSGTLARLRAAGGRFIAATLAAPLVVGTLVVLARSGGRFFQRFFSFWGGAVALGAALVYLELLALAGRLARGARVGTHLPASPGTSARPGQAPGRPRVVWSNPVLWREWRTRAYGTLTTFIRVLNVLVLTAVLALAVSGRTFHRRLDRAYYGALLYVVGLLLLALLASAAFVLEKRDRTLPLLLATTLSAARVVLAKLAGVARQVALPFVLAFVLLLSSLRGGDRDVVLLWLLAVPVYVAGAGLLISAHATRPAAALGLTAVALTAPLLLSLVGRAAGVPQRILGWVLPIWGSSSHFVGASVGYVLLGAVLAAVTAARLRAVAGQGPRP